MMRVLIAGGGTGGHLMPALALARALERAAPGVEPVLVGAERGVEARILPTRPYRYHLLPAEPIYRAAWWNNLRWPLVLARVLRAGARVLTAERPALAVGTGGYAAGPILVQALRRGIPVALQEQNAYPGITTRWLARRARQLHLGFPEARVYLRPGKRTEVCQLGNPIEPPTARGADRMAARQALGIQRDQPVVFVMGGSQGARAINRAVAEAMEAGAFADVAMLWSTGQGAFEQYRRYGDPPLRQVRAFWDPVGDAYAAADVVVARAGAMTTAELCAWGLPAILVPLPSAAAQHQARNAEALAAAGAAIHLPEPRLSGPDLAREVDRLLHEPDRRLAMGRAAAARGQPYAADRIAERLLTLVS